MTRETIQYKDLSVREPAPYGAAGAAWQANFKELADRIGPCNFTATVAPTANDDTGDGYATGSLWYDTVAQRLYWCASAATGAAVWIEISSSATAAITGGTITGITDLAVADGGTGASDAATARTNLGLGTIATQAADSVNIDGGAIDGTAVGANAAAAGSFTTIQASGIVGIGGAPVTGRPLAVYQSVDEQGILLYSSAGNKPTAFNVAADSGDLSIAPTGALICSSPGGNLIRFTSGSYMQFLTAASQPIVFQCGGTFGFCDQDAAGATRLTIDSATGELAIPSDVVGLKLGAGGDARIYYDGTDLRVNPQVVGSGTTRFTGKVGIGPSKPLYSFQVSDQTAASVIVTELDTSVWGSFRAGVNQVRLGSLSAHPLIFVTNDTAQATLDTSGVLQTKGYKSSDGTAGATADVAVAKVGGGTRTLSFKNGLYTGYTDS